MNEELWPNVVVISHSTTETILGNARESTGQEWLDTWFRVKDGDTDDILGFLEIND